MEKMANGSEDCQKGYPPTSLHSFLMRHQQPAGQNSARDTEGCVTGIARRGDHRLTQAEELDKMKPGDTATVYGRIAPEGIKEFDSTYLLNHEDLEVHVVLPNSDGANAYRAIYIEGVPQTTAKELIRNYKALIDKMKAAYLRADVELAPSTGVSIPNEIVANYSLRKVELLTD